MARHRPCPLRNAVRAVVAVALSLSAGTAGAEGLRAVYRHGYGPVHAGPAVYGFADESVRGAYVGAPFTSVPSPNRLVPAPWSYGTYGVPTISGLREAPVAAPSVIVVNARPASVVRHAPGPRILSRGGDGAWDAEDRAGDGVSVATVTVPRR